MHDHRVLRLSRTDVAWRARQLRHDMTPSELRLWKALRGKAVGGLRFRRQHPLGPYILDFYCFEAGLAVEVDGSVHGADGQAEHDERRDAYLSRLGVKVLRVPAWAVGDRLEQVVAWIGSRALELQAARGA